MFFTIGLTETISRRVVARLANRLSPIPLAQQSQQPSQAGVSDQSRPVSSSPENMCCHCKRKCMCRCHLVDPDEKRKDEKESGRSKRTFIHPLSSRNESQTDNGMYFLFQGLVELVELDLTLPSAKKSSALSL